MNLSIHLKTQKILILLVMLQAVFSHSCARNTAVEEAGQILVSQLKMNHYQLYLSSENAAYWNYQEQFPHSVWISYSLTPLEKVASATEKTTDALVECNEAVKVKPSKTPWAEAWDRASVVKEMNRILIMNGISSKTVRVRMIAHAIVASGWKQNVWNYNAWGVKQGSWDKKWYVMPTYEEDELGNTVFIEDATWRAFSDWQEAIQDFKERISPDSDRPAYREAYEYLMSEDRKFRNSKLYWEALGAGNYYTASKFTGDKFARLCGGVYSILR